jgi:heme/copper-type cytochrome/quinol oxidase subunit 2
VVYFIALLAVAAVPLAAIIYAALSKKTGPRTKIAALIALAVMLLTVIVCLVIIFGGPALVKTDEFLPVDIPADKPAAPANDLWILLGFITFMIVLFAAVAVLSFREQRRQRKAQHPSGPKAA